MTRRHERIAGRRLAAALVLACAGCARAPEPAPPAVAPSAPKVAQSPVAAKGPDSPEARVLAALPTATNLRVLVLEPPAANGDAPTRDCRVVACIERNPIVASVAAVDADAREQVTAALDSWFAKSLQATRDCVPRYQHAVVFVAGRGEAAVLLDFDCGRYEIVEGGRATVGNVARPGGLGELNTLLWQAGVHGYEPH
jgi:hypothetical protein